MKSKHDESTKQRYETIENDFKQIQYIIDVAVLKMLCTLYRYDVYNSLEKNTFIDEYEQKKSTD